MRVASGSVNLCDRFLPAAPLVEIGAELDASGRFGARFFREGHAILRPHANLSRKERNLIGRTRCLRIWSCGRDVSFRVARFLSGVDLENPLLRLTPTFTDTTRNSGRLAGNWNAGNRNKQTTIDQWESGRQN
jgi:hypothetical protein